MRERMGNATPREVAQDDTRYPLARLLDIANKCPVHRTLSRTSRIVTELAD